MIPITPKFIICNYQMPLAVYREVAAHLQQIAGLKVAFITSNDREFSYLESQLGGLEITGVDRLAASERLLLDCILSYYANRYNPWEIQA